MSSIIAHVLNKAGAEVHVLQRDNPETLFGWKCTGCGEGAHTVSLPHSLALSAADRHASECRFLNA